jgi:prefoldin beta subunit
MQEHKLQEIQILEHNLQNILYQKQAFQMELSELESGLNELKNSGDEVFKIIGQLMIKSNKENIEKELKEKKEILETRLKSLETQEEKFSSSLSQLREEVLKQNKEEKN